MSTAATNPQLRPEASPCRNSALSWKVICIWIIFACCALCALASIYVWIPDLFKGEIILDRVETPSGDVLQITQEFVGDGYDTRFYHTNRLGREWHSGFDGDARKEWRGKIEIRADGKVSIAVSRKHFIYDLHSHEMIEKMGKPRLVLEFPEDGSASHFVGRPPDK